MLSTTHDFYSTEDALRLLELRTGATVNRVTLYDDPWTATVDEMVDRLMKGVTARTKVVAITWVHSSTGVRLPVREIADALDGRALLCVDGVHGFAAVDVDLPDLGCDFLATGTHKWLFGPRGTGILWAKDFGPLTELIPSFDGFENAARLSPGGYHDFEHRWAVADAFAIQQRITRKAVVERTVAQATQLKEGLQDIDRHHRHHPAGPRRLGRHRLPRRRGHAAGQRGPEPAPSRASSPARRRTARRTSASVPPSPPPPSRSTRRSRP